MMNTPHLDDELLAAVAGADPGVAGETAVSAHLATCDRCAATVAELRSLSIALAELPDLAPSRPLRFLPPVAAPQPSFADRLGGVVRGIFAPALTAGAALVLVGAVGTFAPALPMAQSGQGGAAIQEDAALTAESAAAAAEPGTEAGQERSDAAPSASDLAAGDGYAGPNASPEATPVTLGAVQASPETDEEGDHPAAASPTQDTDALEAATDSERPIWPMLLFSGVALIVLAVMLRWILAPHSG